MVPDDTRGDVIAGVVVGGASLSFLGSSFVILSFMRHPTRFGQGPLSLLLFLSCSDWIWSLAIIVGLLVGALEEDSLILCHIQAFILQYFQIASMLWTTCLAHNLYEVICKTSQRKWTKWYHGFCWISPISLCVFSYSHSGRDGMWCYISTSSGDAIFRFVLYVPLVLAFSVCLFVFIYGRVAIKKRPWSLDGTSGHRERLHKRLLYFLLGGVCLWLLPVTNRVVKLIQGTDDESVFQFILEIGHGTLCLQGFWNAVVYAMNAGSMDMRTVFDPEQTEALISDGKFDYPSLDSRTGHSDDNIHDVLSGRDGVIVSNCNRQVPRIASARGLTTADTSINSPSSLDGFSFQ